MVKSMSKGNLRAIAFAGASTASVGAFCAYNQMSYHSFNTSPIGILQPSSKLFQSGACLCEPTNFECGNKSPIDAVDPTTYYYEEFPTWPERNLNKDHAVNGLTKPGLIERFKAYHRRRLGSNDATSFLDSEVLLASIRIGASLNGHDGIVHGGVTSLLLDESFGLGYEAFVTDNKDDNSDEFPMVVTANLNIDYNAPIPSNSDIVIRIFHTRTEGRKVYMHARIESPDRKTLYAQGSVLFIKIRPDYLLKTK